MFVCDMCLINKLYLLTPENHGNANSVSKCEHFKTVCASISLCHISTIHKNKEIQKQSNVYKILHYTLV